MRGYEWAEDVEAVTLTFLRGVPVEEVAGALAFDPASERRVVFDDAFGGVGDAAYPVQVDELADWLVVVEPGGFLMNDDELLSGLSSQGTAVSVFWNINAQSRFVVAHQGSVVRSFDPVIPDYEPDGDPLPEEDGLAFGEEDVASSALSLTLLERLTGVRVEEEWLLGRPRRTWDAPEPAPYRPPQPAAEAPRAGGFFRRVLGRSG